MSGPMTPELAQAASHQVFMSNVAASGMSPGRFIAASVRAQLDGKPQTERDSVPGRAWRAMHPSARGVLVMLAAEAQGSPEHLARQPWESFSTSDRAAMAATARMLRGELKDEAALW